MSNVDALSIIEKIQEGENSEIEFKESLDELPKSFWETYSSFANTSGGYILLGVSEKMTKIIGVKNPEKIKDMLFKTANNKSKASHNILDNEDVIEHEIEGKIIIEVHVKELPFSQKPLYLNNNPLNAYVRKNEADCKITMEDYRRFVRNSEDNSDAELLDNYTLEDLNADSVLALKNIISLREPEHQFMTMDNLDFLTAIGVFRIDRNDGRKRKLTLAGLLFLGKLEAITQKVHHFHLEYMDKRGSVERWRDRVSTGDINYPDLNLFEFYRVVREKLRLTVEDKFELDEKSVRKPPSELDKALREALANMIVHADYLDPETTVKVIVDNLYYVFQNPGIMKVSSEQFFTGGYSFPRNNTLIQYFRRIGESERAGTGGKEILNVMSQNRYRLPDLITDYRSTTLKLWTAIPSETYEDLSVYSKAVLQCFNNDRMYFARSDIKNATKLSDHYVRKAIDELISRKLIKSKGKGRAIRYYRTPSMVEAFDIANQFADHLRTISSKVRKS